MKRVSGVCKGVFGALLAFGLVLGGGGDALAEGKPGGGGGGKPAYSPPMVPRPDIAKLRHLKKAMVVQAGRCKTKAELKRSQKFLRKMFKTMVGPLAGCLNSRGVDAPRRKGQLDVWVRFDAELRKRPRIRVNGPIVGGKNAVGQCVQSYVHRYVVSRALKTAKKKKLPRAKGFGPCAVRTTFSYKLAPPPKVKPCKPGIGRPCPRGVRPRRR